MRNRKAARESPENTTHPRMYYDGQFYDGQYGSSRELLGVYSSVPQRRQEVETAGRNKANDNEATARCSVKM